MSSMQQMFTLVNGLGSAVPQLATSLGGMSGEYAIVDQCNGKTLPPDGQCQIAITFSPTVWGTQSFTLSADGKKGTATLSIRGTGSDTATISIGVTGSGSVSAPGLTCSAASCAGSYTRATIAPTVNAVATPAGNAKLQQWTSGPCMGSTTPTCAFDLSKGNQTAQVSFSSQ
jgi:hypothetical protein